MKSKSSTTMRKEKVDPILLTLSVIPAAMIGKRIVIEMKNDSEVVGTIDETDKFMNITLLDAEQKWPEGKVMELEWVYIKGITIRYIHLGNNVNLISECKQYVKMKNRIKYQNKAKGRKKEQTHHNNINNNIKNNNNNNNCKRYIKQVAIDDVIIQPKRKK